MSAHTLLSRVRARVRTWHSLQDASGQMVILIAPFMVMVAVAGVMVMDVGLAYGTRIQQQRTADLVALAAVADLPNQTDATASAAVWMQRNDFDPSATGNSATVTFPAADQVRVEVETSTRMTFGRLFGLSDWSISAAATAELRLEPLPYSLMAMSETACSALFVHGNATVDVGGGTYTRSSCTPNALRVGGQGELTSSRNDVVGDGDSTGGAVLDPPPTGGHRYIEDPYADVSDPVRSGACYAGPQTINSGSVTLSPGRYCVNISISSNADVTLLPGIYFFEAGLEVSGSGSFTSGTDEVLLVQTCPDGPCNGSTPANFSFTGNVDMTMIGHSGYGGIVIWTDRTATGNTSVKLAGQAQQGFSGTIYSITGNVDISGSSGATLTLNTSIVADTIEISGGGTISISYDAATAPTEFVPALVE